MTGADGMKGHWENIYGLKKPNEVSWFQERPRASWELMKFLGIRKDSAIIDVGGGDSLFVDFLFGEGFSDITVLDISGKAISRAKERLGSKADSVEWIVSDVTEFVPARRYDLWHDRAVLHFLTEKDKINRYVETAKRALRPAGKLIVGAFSDKGPEKCSGLAVKRYSEAEMCGQFRGCFTKVRCIFEDHVTPFNTTQNFIFCGFQPV